MEQVSDLAEAGELRNYCAEAIENMTGEPDVLLVVAERCLQDRSWKCRMRGLHLARRLVKRQRQLLDHFLPLIEPLATDDVEEIRDAARRIVKGCDR